MLVRHRAGAGRAVCRRDGVGRVAPIVPVCRLPRALAGESRLRRLSSTLQGYTPGPRSRARSAKVLSTAETWGAATQDPQGMRAWLIASVCVNMALGDKELVFGRNSI